MSPAANRSDGSDPTGRFTAREIADMLGMPLAQLRQFVREGVLVPHRGARGEYRFSFQDVVLLRSARGLTERLPLRKVRRALQALRHQVPEDRPLAAMQLRADGENIVVREDGCTWHPESGQVLLDFSKREPPDRIATLTPHAGLHVGNAGKEKRAMESTADSCFDRGVEFEAYDPERAKAAYLEAIELDPDHVDACINLGRLLHENGEVEHAIAMYVRAVELRPNDPVGLFNLAVALEDRGDVVRARQVYQMTVDADPNAADAHYNLARLCEVAGDKMGAFRHLRRYRELTRA